MDMIPPSEWPRVLCAAIESANGLRDKHGTAAAGAFAMKAELSGLPGHIDAASALSQTMTDEEEEVLSTHLDVFAMRAELEDRCPEFEHLDARPIRFVWLKKNPTKHDMIVFGRAKLTPQREQDLWAGPGPAPWWTIELGLPTWLLSSPTERRRLLHHEIAHLAVQENVDDEERVTYTPRLRGHDIEENATTAMRFGVARKEHAIVIAAAMRHPTTTEKMKEWGVDPVTGQGLLFGPYGQGKKG